MKLTGENILSKIQDRLVLYQHIYPFVRGNQSRTINRENTICLFCQPRGGSTWLAEILLHIQGSVLIDEPLWRGKMKTPWEKPELSDRKVPEIADLDFYFNQYIPEFEEWPEAKTVFDKILSGRSRSKGLYEEQDYVRMKNRGIYITKFCYANLLMPWLIRQFDFKSILLTRHPCAVIASQLKHTSWKNLKIDEPVVWDEFPYTDFYRSKVEKVGKIGNIETFLAVVWALNFQQTAMHPQNNQDWLTVSYERLSLYFESEIHRINQHLPSDLNPDIIDREKPSKSTSFQTNGKPIFHKKVAAWKKELTKKQISDILGVLERFDIDIYNQYAEPDYRRLYTKEDLP
jgi:hypothetical protein